MSLSHEQVGSKILAKIRIYICSPEQNCFLIFAMRYPVSPISCRGLVTKIIKSQYTKEDMY